MRVLLISEGRHELGDDFQKPAMGALAMLVRRTANRPLECTTEKISNPKFRATHGKGDRLVKKAIRCMMYARDEGFDAIVLVIDQDDDPDRRRQFDQAQDDVRVGTPRALGIAVRTFDAWMLPDEQALSAALGTTIQRQPNPEEISDPKEHCRRLRAGAGLDPGLTEMYEKIAAITRIDVLEKRCPKGFQVFAERLRRI